MILKEIFSAAIDDAAGHADVPLDDTKPTVKNRAAPAAADADPLAAAARATIGPALAAARGPLRARLRMLDGLGDDAAFLAELEKLQADMPALLAEMNESPETTAAAEAIAEAQAAALFNGVADEQAELEEKP